MTHHNHADVVGCPVGMHEYSVSAHSHSSRAGNRANLFRYLHLNQDFIQAVAWLRAISGGQHVPVGDNRGWTEGSRAVLRRLNPFNDGDDESVLARRLVHQHHQENWQKQDRAEFHVDSVTLWNDLSLLLATHY